MARQTVIDALNELDRSLFGDRMRNILDEAGPPFDISRPNIHESKSEFLHELDTVQAAFDHCTGLISSLFPKDKNDDPAQRRMRNRLAKAIDSHAEEEGLGELASAMDLSLRNVVQTGFFFTSALIVLDMQKAYRKRLKELKDQEKEFWNVSHRPPNYYARTIALRFARHYARQKQQRPTFGTSRDGPHASTEFGRALEQVFGILGIKAKVRKPAEWALAQLTEDDWAPPQNALMGGLLGLDFGGRGASPERRGRGMHPDRLNALSMRESGENKGS